MGTMELLSCKSPQLLQVGSRCLVGEIGAWEVIMAGVFVQLCHRCGL